MPYTQGLYPIVRKGNLAKNIYDFTILCPEIAAEASAGQFAHVKAPGFMLRRPISICETNQKAGTIRLVMEIRGDGTERLAAENAGGLMDLMAPLGHGFTLLPPDKKAVVIGGGIGVPPMLEVAKHYTANATAILGFRSASAVILKEDFEQIGAKVVLCTDDGTAGQKGFVTSALEELFLTEKPDVVYSCGPTPMLKAVAAMAEAKGIYCEVSLEERMGCGVGACLVCACKTKKDGTEGYSHVCKDGPVFDSREVVF
ncbi:MAG: dihydroorotate dehydrogenase electron transfer subunit [Oscillospiraceae bacterium]|nr:dihydroorotate dehydrogenase electron transfer subunit [Oscillospiraceae bacterium]